MKIAIYIFIYLSTFSFASCYFSNNRREMLCDKHHKFWEFFCPNRTSGVESGYLFTQTDSVFLYIHTLENKRKIEMKRNKPYIPDLSWAFQGDSLKIQDYTYYISKLNQDTMILKYKILDLNDGITWLTKYDTLVPSKNQKMR